MRAMTIEQITEPSFFSRLDVRTKLVFLFFVITIIIVWENIWLQLALFVLVLGLAMNSHLSPIQIKRAFILMIPIMIIVIVTQALFNIRGETEIVTLFTVPEWVPLYGGPVTIYWEGLLFGLVVVLRFLTPILALPLVVLTTDVNELVLGLVEMHIPYKVAYIFSIALRFVPFIFAQVDAINEAQRLRGLALEKMNFIRRIPVFASMGVPLILGSLVRAQTLDVVLQSKAFRGSAERSYLDEIHMRPIDIILVAAMVIILVGSIIGRIFFGVGDFVA